METIDREGTMLEPVDSTSEVAIQGQGGLPSPEVEGAKTGPLNGLLEAKRAFRKAEKTAIDQLNGIFEEGRGLMVDLVTKLPLSRPGEHSREHVGTLTGSDGREISVAVKMPFIERENELPEEITFQDPDVPALQTTIRPRKEIRVKAGYDSITVGLVGPMEIAMMDSAWPPEIYGGVFVERGGGQVDTWKRQEDPLVVTRNGLDFLKTATVKPAEAVPVSS